MIQRSRPTILLLSGLVAMSAVVAGAAHRQMVLAPVGEESGVVIDAATVAANERTNSQLIMAFVGDIMLDRNVRRRMNEFGQAYPFANIASADFFRADVLIGNLEGAISDHLPPVKSIDFGFDEAVAPLLKQYGFDAVSLANNHALDQGTPGYHNTQVVLEKNGIGHFGHQVADDTSPWETTVKGKTIALFGYNITDNPIDEKAALPAIRAAAETHDAVFVVMHWGAEYVPRPATDIRDLGRRFIDAGATAVIGAHPHVMQGMELWKGRPIFWSLGNFVFDQDWSEETQRGLVITLGMTDESFEVQLLPTTVIASQPTLAEGEERARLLQRFAERSDLPADVAKQVAGGTLRWPRAGEGVQP